MAASRVRFGKRGLKDYRALSHDQQKRCDAALLRFREDATHPGLNFEALRGRAGSYSIRMDGGWRILLLPLEDDQGRVWEVDGIGGHDIYRRLRR